MSPVGWAEKKGGHTIQDEGADLPAKDDLDFQGAGVIAANVGGATVVTIPGGVAVLPDHDHAGVVGDGGQFDPAVLESGGATATQVLTADGAGNVAWEDQIGSALAVFFFYNDASADPITYKQMLPAHSAAAEELITVAGLIDNDVIEEFITNNGSPNSDFLLNGLYTFHIHAHKSAGTQVLALYAEIYVRTDPGGVETLLGTTHDSTALNGVETEYTLHAAIGDTDIDLTDRIVVKVRAAVSGGGTAPTTVLHVEGDTFSSIQAPVVTAGGGAGSDTTAIHDNVAGEIAAVAEKVAPIAADMLLIEDSAALNVKKMVQVGNLPAAAPAADTLCVFRPYQNEPPTANFATLDTSNQRPVLDFDAATDESAVFSDILPERYGGGGLDVILHLAATSDTNAAHLSFWDVSIEAIAAQVLSADGFAAVQSGSVNAPATYIETTLTISFTSGAQMDGLVAGGAFRLKVTRDANNGSDDWSGDAELLYVEVKETP